MFQALRERSILVHRLIAATTRAWLQRLLLLGRAHAEVTEYRLENGIQPPEFSFGNEHIYRGPLEIFILGSNEENLLADFERIAELREVAKPRQTSWKEVSTVAQEDVVSVELQVLVKHAPQTTVSTIQFRDDSLL